MTEPPAPASTAPAPTSADVPREGPRAGNAEAQPAIPLTDGQILDITHTANIGEIEQARVALTRSKDARVRSLAQMMVQDHSQADKKGMVLAKKENLERSPSAASQSLESDAQSTTGTLRADPAADFDKSYVDAQYPRASGGSRHDRREARRQRDEPGAQGVPHGDSCRGRLSPQARPGRAERAPEVVATRKPHAGLFERRGDPASRCPAASSRAPRSRRWRGSTGWPRAHRGSSVA